MISSHFTTLATLHHTWILPSVVAVALELRGLQRFSHLPHLKTRNFLYYLYFKIYLFLLNLSVVSVVSVK